MTHRWLLTCCKTGRWAHYATEAMARRAAMTLGWTDYTLEAVK